MRVMLQRVFERKEWKFFAALPKAAPGLALAWWLALLLRGVRPAAVALAMGVLVGAVHRGDPLAGPYLLVGAIFILLQVLNPIHQALSANLGDRTAAWLYDRLTEACVRPPGMGHLEDPKLTNDLTVARDFDLGMTGPPLAISMDFIASGMVEIVGGIACAVILFRYAWWAPILLAGAWAATHWLLRESAIWRDRNTEEVRGAQRDADYAYRLAVDPPASKELRLFGLGGWMIDRFMVRRTRLHELQYAATRLRERPVVWSMLLVVSANVVVFWLLARAAGEGRIGLGEAVVYVQSAVGVSMIAFGGFSWALDGAAAPVAAVLRLEPAMRPAGALRSGSRRADSAPAREIRLRDVTFAYPSTSLGTGAAGAAVLEHFDLTIPAGSSLAIVGQNGAGKTTIAKLLCRLYDPQSGGIEIDGVDVRDFDLASWRSRVAAVFQDFMRLELPLRDNVAPAGAPDEIVRGALVSAGAANLAALDTVLARAYDGGTDLSGGQWQRVALARALAAVALGAGVVLLDEPTAQPDALLALWLMLLGKGVLERRPGLAQGAAIGLAVSTAATWFLRTVSTRVQRRFRDKVTIALESHVARLQASIATIAHQERPEYLDRLAVLRDQVFVLDHMYMSVFSTCGWILRLAVTVALLVSIHPGLVLLAAFALPTVLTSAWRPAVERLAQERGAQFQRLALHLFTLATTAPP